jgi:hypothetical protein
MVVEKVSNIKLIVKRPPKPIEQGGEGKERNNPKKDKPQLKVVNKTPPKSPTQQPKTSPKINSYGTFMCNIMPTGDLTECGEAPPSHEFVRREKEVKEKLRKTQAQPLTIASIVDDHGLHDIPLLQDANECPAW